LLSKYLHVTAKHTGTHTQHLHLTPRDHKKATVHSDDVPAKRRLEPVHLCDGALWSSGVRRLV
jgi:hypothetical protein